MQRGNRVIINTLILYGKMGIAIVVGLLSTRLVLQGLGVEDYGIYNLIAGMISMLAFLNTAMAASTQRFMSFCMGKNDWEQVRKVFYYSVLLHIAIGLVVILLIEGVGLYLVNHVLSIPDDKIGIARNVLHYLSVSTFFSVLAVPYIATLISHENMLLLSIIDIAEALFKLLIAVIVLSATGNRLILYSAFMATVMCVSLIIKIICCHRKYPETRIQWSRITDKNLMKEMSSFAGWNMIGATCGIARGQGIAMLLNVFFGVVVNAAYGIANQVNGLLSFFSVAIMQSIRPQIIKSEGGGDRERMPRLSLIACKYMFYLCAIFAIPLILSMPYVLQLWLKDVPEYTVTFCRLILLFTLTVMLSQGVMISIEAVGSIKWLQIVVGTLHIVNFPIGYLLLKSGFPAYSVLLCMICEEIVCTLLRVTIAKRIVGLSIRQYIREVFLKTVPLFVIAFALGHFVSLGVSSGFAQLSCTIVAGAGVFLLLCWFCGIGQEERARFIHLLYPKR